LNDPHPICRLSRACALANLVVSRIQVFIHFWNQTSLNGPPAESQTRGASPFEWEWKSPSQIVYLPTPLSATGWCQTVNNSRLAKTRCARKNGWSDRPSHCLVSQIGLRDRQVLPAPSLVHIRLHNRHLLLAPVPAKLLVPVLNRRMKRCNTPCTDTSTPKLYAIIPGIGPCALKMPPAQCPETGWSHAQLAYRRFQHPRH